MGNFDHPTGVAVDQSGNIYVASYSTDYSGSTHGGVYQFTHYSGSIDFGSVPEGEESGIVWLTFTFTVSVTLGPMPLGDGQDFAVADDLGDCTEGNSFNQGDTCTMAVMFTPTSVGQCHDQAMLADTNGNVLVAVDLYGVGTYSSTPVKIVPTITWATPTPVEAGTVLGAEQLNATADVPGTFTYYPEAGTVLKTTGPNTLIAVFTPTDTANYKVVSVTRTLMVTPSTVPADFMLRALKTSDTSIAGSGGVYGISVTSKDTSSPFNDPVTMSVTGCPSGWTCSFTQPSVVPGSYGDATVLMVMPPQQSASARNLLSKAAPLAMAALLLPVLSFLRKKHWARLLVLLVCLAGVMGAINGCAGMGGHNGNGGGGTGGGGGNGGGGNGGGGNGGGGTGGGGNGGGGGSTSKSYTITVIGTSGSISHNINVYLTVQ